MYTITSAFSRMSADSIWKDLEEDTNSGFSLGKGPKNLVVKEMKRLTFYCILIACLFFFSWIHIQLGICTYIFNDYVFNEYIFN